MSYATRLPDDVIRAPQKGGGLALSGTWTANAKMTIESNPDYFVWWYTVKSVGLCAAIAYAAYLYGRSKGPA